MAETDRETSIQTRAVGDAAIIYASDYLNKLTGERIERECRRQFDSGRRTLIINFRHFLMALTIAPHLKNWSRMKRFLYGLQLTDETFALVLNQFQERNPGERHVFALNGVAHASWFLGTLTGYGVSWLIPDTSRFGCDFALPGMFIALVVFQIKSRAFLIAGVAGALAAIGIKALGFAHVAILLAAVIGALAGVGVEKWKPAR